MIVDELVTLLGLQMDPAAEGEANRFSGAISGITTAAIAAGAALAAVSSAVIAYAVQQSEAIDAASGMASAFGLSYQALQELEYAAQSSGAEIEEFYGDLENLAKIIADSELMTELGINTRDATGQLMSTDAVLSDIAKKMEGMSNAEQNMFYDQLGLSPGALRILQQGEKGIADLREEARSLGLVLDDSAKEKAANFQSSLLRSKSVVDALGKAVSVGLMPAMTDSLDVFTGWIIANREIVASGITQVVEGVGMGFSMLGDVIGFLIDQVSSFIGPIDGMADSLDVTQAVAITVAIAMTALAASVLAATWPILAIVAAIGAVVLILDDLYSAIQGQDSVIGGWIESFAGAFPAISGVISSVIDLLVVVSSFFTGPMVDSVKMFGSVVDGVIGSVIGTIGGVIGEIESVLSGVNPFEILGDYFSDQVDKIIGMAGELAGKIGGFFGSVFGSSGSLQASSAATAPVPASVIQSGGGSTVNNNVTNNINGAGNPSAVANEVVNRGGLGQTLQQSRPGMTGPVVG